MSVTPDFYGANSLSPYPFVRQLLPVSRIFIDASVSVTSEYVDQKVIVNYVLISPNDPRKIEVSVGGQVLISRTSPVTVELFGAYEIWTVGGAHGYATFVTVADQVLGEWEDPAGLELVQHVLSGIGGSIVDSIGTPLVEAAGPGDNLTLELGRHMQAEIRGQQIIITASYSKEDADTDDVECDPTASRSPKVLRTINGVGPDVEGGFTIKPRNGSTFIIDGYREDEEKLIQILNTAEPCCDCDDYKTLFNTVLTTHERLVDLRIWPLSNQYKYKDLLLYVRFIMQVEMLDSDFEAECP